MRRAVRLLALAAAFAGSGPAFAQGVSLSRFEPSERGSRFFFGDTLDLGHPDPRDARTAWAVGMPMSLAPVVETWGDHRQGKQTGLVRDALELDPGASVTFFPGARFAINVPVTAFQHGEDTQLGSVFFPAPASPSLGDIRIGFDLHILGPKSRDVNGIALAGGVTGWVPTGSTDNYTGDGFARFGIHVASAARYDWLLLAARAGYMYRRDGYLGGSRFGPELNAVLSAAFIRGGFTVGPELVGETELDTKFAKRASPLELMLGAHQDIVRIFRVGAGVGTELVPGMGASPFRAMLSIEWLGSAGPPSDRDQDGVPDHEDMCPDVPGDPLTQGCPSAPPVEIPPVDRGPMTPDPVSPGDVREPAQPLTPETLPPQPRPSPPKSTPNEDLPLQPPTPLPPRPDSESP